MIDFKQTGESTFKLKVRLADLENLDYMQYANMFYNYRLASVWSAPEVLQQHKKIPQELT